MNSQTHFLNNDGLERDFINYYSTPLRADSLPDGERFLSDQEIQDIDNAIGEANLIPYEAVIQTGSHQAVESPHRKSKICWLEDNENFHWLFKKIARQVQIANRSLWHFDIVGFSEGIQYSIYYGDGGHYGWHLDIGSGWAQKRKISGVVQLTDPEEYKGGELQLQMPTGEATAPKEKGSLSLFPSYIRHRVSPVTEGTRKSLVVWVSGPAWR